MLKRSYTECLGSDSGTERDYASCLCLHCCTYWLPSNGRNRAL